MTPLLKTVRLRVYFYRSFSAHPCLEERLSMLSGVSWDSGVCCHTHRFVVVLHYIFHKATVCFLAKDNAY